MQPIEISKVTARRFVLGRQGLWPGRRWTGLEGAAQALGAMEALQLDPLNVAARSQDIALWGRVNGYQPEFLDQLLYTRRQFFDYGGSLFIYAMSELPYWRLHMDRRQNDTRWATFAAAHSELLDEVRTELYKRGPLGNRDFNGKERVEGNYRGRKDSALALFYLWLTGELMVHHRRRFERLYDLRANVAPPKFDFAAPEEEAERYFTRKPLAFYGLISELGWKNGFADFIHRPVGKEEARRRLDELVVEGTILPVQVEAARQIKYMLAEDLPLVSALQAGQTPAGWQPVEASTTEEAVLLAPLEIVSARGRAKDLFDFEYVWEVYKPAHTRRWGYYTLPILWGDRLVGRLDPKLERKTETLSIKGFWLEDQATGEDPDFAAALGRGLVRFGGFVKASRLSLPEVFPPAAKAWIKQNASGQLDLEG